MHYVPYIIIVGIFRGYKCLWFSRIRHACTANIYNHKLNNRIYACCKTRYSMKIKSAKTFLKAFLWKWNTPAIRYLIYRQNVLISFLTVIQRPLFVPLEKQTEWMHWALPRIQSWRSCLYAHLVCRMHLDPGKSLGGSELGAWEIIMHKEYQKRSYLSPTTCMQCYMHCYCPQKRT